VALQPIEHALATGECVGTPWDSAKISRTQQLQRCAAGVTHRRHVAASGNADALGQTLGRPHRL